MNDLFTAGDREFEVGDVVSAGRGRRYMLMEKTIEPDCIGFIWNRLNQPEKQPTTVHKKKERKASRQSRRKNWSK